MQRWILVILIFAVQTPIALAEVKASKANTYAVLAPRAGVSTSKANAYAVLRPPAGISTSKANAYAVLAPRPGVSVSKALAYAVLTPPPPGTAQPSVFIMTKLDFLDFRACLGGSLWQH